MGNKEGRHNKTELPTGSILAVQLESQNTEDNTIIHERIVLNSYNCHGGILYSLYGGHSILTLQKLPFYKNCSAKDYPVSKS